MRVDVVPEGLAEQLALSTGLVPTPLVAGAFGMFTARILLAATKLGVFEALAEGEKSEQEVARAISASAEGTRALLRALNGFRFLRRRAERYSLTQVSRRWLLKSAKYSMRDAMLFLELLWSWMGRLEPAVLSGKPERIQDTPQPPEMWERYLRGLAALARPASREVVRKVRLDGSASRLLDVGGGHGEYSAAFCRRYPALSAEVLDLSPAVEVGRQIVSEGELAERVRFRAGDLRTSEWGAGHDAVLLFNVIHNATPEEAQEAIRRAARALRPGGKLAIMEGEYRAGRGDLSAPAGFGELFFFMVSGARTYPEATLRQWMAEAGFEKLRALRLRMAPAVLLTGQVRAG